MEDAFLLSVIAIRPIRYLLIMVLLVFGAASSFAVCDPQFGSQTDMGTVQCYDIDEVSGIAASRLNPGVYWVHNDSGDPNRIFALNEQGGLLGVYYIDGFAARDWEDIAVGPGPVDGVNYIYIGNIGDNYAQYDYKYVGRIPEPVVDLNQGAVTQTLYGVETITLTLPDQRRDTETVMVDPWTKDLFIVSKRENNVNVYRAAYPQPTGGAVVTMELVNTLDLGWIVGGDISPSGTQIIMKHGAYAYQWCREPGQTISQALSVAPNSVPYVQEQQGEAICWTAAEDGYFTLSEGHNEHMFFYEDLNGSDVDNINPYLDIAEPTPFGTFETCEPAITVLGSAYDNTGVDKVTYSLSGATEGTGVAFEVHGTLIASGSEWKYSDNGLDLGSAWTGIQYDDYSWAAGSAEIGYGDGD
ncbi:MAG: hypothetical protein KJ626_07880, partial [Verrucomicrobia bacterium]|nr:hypothetical protein [Verrucomicrobiota bacterium]